MSEPAKTYHLLDFRGPGEATRFARAVMDFVRSAQGADYGLDPSRVEIWAEGGTTWSRLYLSEGAMRAARALLLPVTTAGTLRREQLPTDRVLIYGTRAEEH